MATNYDLNVNTKQAQENLDKAEKSVDELTMSVIEGERAVTNWQKAMSKTTNVIPEDSKKLNDLKLSLKQVREELKAAKLDQKQANLEMKKAKENTTELTGSMKLLDKATGGAVTMAKNQVTAFKGLIKGAKGFKIALASTGIGLFVVAISSIVQAFKSSEAGQEKWERGMAMIGAAVKVVTDLLASLGRNLIAAFESPKEALSDFGGMLKTMVMDKFNAILEGLGLIGSALKKAFTGDFKGAMSDAGEGLLKLNNELNPIMVTTNLIVEGSKKLADATGKVVDEISREVEIMNQVTKMRQKAHHIERALITERAQANRDINELRLKAEQRDKYSAEERIKLLKEAQAIEQDITDKEIAAKQLKIDAMKMEQALGDTTKEQKDELAALEGELIDLDTKRLRSQRLLQTQITTATNQALAEKQAEIDAKKQMELDYAAWQKDYELSLLSEDEEATERKLMKIDEEFQLKMEQAREHHANKMMTDAELEEIEAELIKERDAVKLDYMQSVADKEFNIQKKKNLKKLNDEDRLERQKIKRKNRSLNAIVQLAGAESKVGRMALIAKNVLAAKEMIMEAKKTIAFSKSAVANSTTAVAEGTAKTAKVGFPQNIPMLLMYAVQAVGIIGAIRKAVKGAKKSTSGTGVGGDIPEPAEPSVPSVASVTETAQAQAFQPSFNTLGTTQGNQIAEALGTQPPVQAFVVSQDVTTAQSLQNNIVSSASLG